MDARITHLEVHVPARRPANLRVLAGGRVERLGGFFGSGSRGKRAAGLSLMFRGHTVHGMRKGAAVCNG